MGIGQVVTTKVVSRLRLPATFLACGKQDASRAPNEIKEKSPFNDGGADDAQNEITRNVSGHLRVVWLRGFYEHFLCDAGISGLMPLLRTFIFVFVGTALGLISRTQADTLCGWIGSQVGPMTRAVAASLGMAVPHGVIFEQPQPGSPAARAKIHAGDVVTRINGRPLESPREFEQRILAMAPGTRIHLRVFRNRQPITFTVPLSSTKCLQRP